MLKLRITRDGFLMLDRGYGEKEAACPYARAATSPPNLPSHTRCGDWCALFGEWETSGGPPGYVGYLTLCDKKPHYAHAFQDDRQVPVAPAEPAIPGETPPEVPGADTN